MNDHGTAPTWRKSSASNPNGNCVELARTGDGRVGMRNSRDVDGAVLDYPADGFAGFLDAVRSGALDGVAPR